MKRISLYSLFLCLFLYCRPTFGQADGGTPPWLAYDVGAVDTISIANLNVMLNVPVMSKNGAIPFTANLVGGDSLLSYNSTSTQLTPGIVAMPLTPMVSGILSPFGYTQVLGIKGADYICGSGDGNQYYGFYLQFADGTTHNLPGSLIVGSACTGSLTTQPLDGSGWTVTINASTYNPITQAGVTVVSAGGLIDNIQTATIQDAQSTPNKIYYSEQEFFDTLGIAALVVNANQSGQLGWFIAGETNENEYQTLVAANLKTSFGCSGVLDYPTTAYPPGLTTNIGFSDTRNIGLVWEPNGAEYTGRLQKITERGGGTVTFNYNPNSLANNGLNCTWLQPVALTRTTSDGTVSYSSSYSLVSGVNVETVTKLDIALNKTVYQFTEQSGAANPLTYKANYINNGTLSAPSYGSPATQRYYCYNGVAFSATCATQQVNLPITQVDVYTYSNGMSTYSRSETQYDGGPSGTCNASTGIGCYGNVTKVARYDFGTSTTPLSATTSVYSATSSCGPGSTIKNRLCSSTAVIGGSVVAASKNTYDAYGNLTIASVSPNGGSSYLANTTANTYNPNGTPIATYDLGNNKTTYDYSGTYTSSPTNRPFATKITAPSGIYTQAAYDSWGGVKTKDIDVAGNPTLYGYTNLFNRITSVTDPLLNVTTQTYSPTEITSELTFNGTSSVNNVDAFLDGYGRTINVQKQQGPGSSNYDTVSTAYGFSGGGSPNQAYISTNVPCTEPLNSRCPVTNQIFRDMLGRVGWTSIPATGQYVQTQYILQDVLKTLAPAPSGESTKSVQTEYDGLGRPISVCKISPNSVSGSVSCGQKNGSYNGVLTGYSYASTTGSQTVFRTRGAQTRSTTVDGLGRLTSSTTPEGGTTQYFWDAAPPVCYNNVGWPTPGDLGARKDNAGNYICYGYDALHRLVGVLNRPLGGNCFGFIYDSATPPAGSGITVQNTAGRMVEAYTNNDCNGTTNVVTDEWFSYDKNGHMTDMWELTPHSTQYYHSTATFAGNGVVTSLQLASPSLYTMNYTLDGEGRWNTMAQGSSSIVTGPKPPAQMYNAAGQPIEVDLTSTDKDLYTYDANTGNMKTFEFEVGTANETGVLTWNPNNTLQQLAITDGFNSGGSQTCASSYDDLARLTVFDCGSGKWGQNFGYDQYDNLTQTVIPPDRTGSTWNPGYSVSPSNNHVIGATYDVSGNMTNDGGMNVYGYDQYDKLAWTAGSGTPTCGTSGKCITYDAFRRMVEKSNNSAWTEIWYTQVPGSQITMSGTTASYGYWPSPGRGTFVASGTNVFLHQDWLGNDRIVSAVTGHTVSADRAYAPYGEQYNTFGSTNPIFGMFAGLTGDFDSGVLFDTPNRELAQYQGRWFSPDPAGAGWNAYAYASDPLSSIDPTGLQAACAQYPCPTPGLWWENEEAQGGGEFADYSSWYWDQSTNGATYGFSAIQGFGYSGYGTFGSQSAGPDTAIMSAYSSQYPQNFDNTTILSPTPSLPSLFGVPCSGPGVPCSVSGGWSNFVSNFSEGTANGMHGSFTYNVYNYRILDENWNPVSVTQVTEFFQDVYGTTGPGTWTFGDRTLDLNGGFQDNVGFNLAVVQNYSFEAIQTFSAVFQGITYQLPNQFLMFGSTSGGYVFSASFPITY
jgi:RHS repeat-associated protein